MTARLALLALGLGLGLGGIAEAEPYLAVQQGMKCGGCHVNPSGGGMRNAYGNIFARTQLPARPATLGDDPWTGMINSLVSFGGDARAGWRRDTVPGAPSQTDTAVTEVRLYLQLNAIPDRLSVHVDQWVAPDDFDNREAYAKYTGRGGRWYVKAGEMYLPYGLRLEDDTAFVRQVPGINFATPDGGVEAGWETARWTTQLSVMQGGDQLGVRSAHVRPGWRVGASFNTHDTGVGRRHMANLFAGWRTGPVAWLAEFDHIDDETFVVPASPRVLLLEANWRPRQGHNLKFGVESYDPDTGADTQRRLSLLWEYTPVPFVQLRVGNRRYDGDDAIGFFNRRLNFAEVHGFF